MFTSFKLPTLRPRAKSFSGPSTCHGSSDDTFSLCKPPRTPVVSSKQKKNNRKRKEVY